MDTTLRVLIVEDSENDAALLVRELRRGGYAVTFERVETHTAMSAALDQEPWDVVISDYSMPQFSATAALMLLKGREVDIPFIIVSGTIGEDTAVTALKAGAHDFIVKGNWPRLIPAIQRELSEAEGRRVRRQAEAALRESERRLSLVYSNVSDIIFYLAVEPDDQFRFLSINPVFLKATGLTESQVVGKLVQEVIPEPAHALVLGRYKDAIRDKKTVRWEEVSVYPAGTKHGEVSVTPVFDEQGHCTNLVGAVHDITERKQGEEALRQAETKYRTLVEQLPAITYVVTLGEINRTTYISPQVEALLGFSPEEWQADPDLWIKQLYPDDRERVLAEIQRLDEAGGGPMDIEYRLLTRTGGVFWFRNQSVPVRDETGRAQYAHGMLLNITERKRAEEEIRSHAARTEALARTAARLNAQLSLATVLDTICEEAAHALNAPAAAVTLHDAQQQVLRLVATFGLPSEFRAAHVPIPRARYEDLVRPASPVIVTPDVQALPGLPNAELDARYNVRTVAAASMRREGQLLGTVSVNTFGEVRHFTKDEQALLQGLADQAAQAIANARLFAEAERRLDHVQALRHIDTAISASLDLRVTLNVFLEEVLRQLGADAAGVLLLNAHTHTLEYAAGRGFRTKGIERSRPRLGEGYPGRAALERRTVRVPNLGKATGDLSRAMLHAEEKFQAYYGVPLIAKGHVKGVLEIFHRAPLDPDVEWLDFLEALAGQAAIAVDNVALFEDLQRSNTQLIVAYDATIEGCSRALDLRDKETEGHTQRVTEMTLRLARALGIGDEELVHIRRGALLHDIGKMGVPDGILLKPGPLTDEEWVSMRKHPVYAYEMLSPVIFLRPALDIPYCHHEKWDGTGYPRGLKGEQIPLAARVFAVVDVWDALRSDRPYRPGWPEAKVREHIRSGAGTHFDPAVGEAFLSLES